MPLWSSAGYHPARNIAFLYIVLAGLWITLSDSLLGLLPADQISVTQLQMIKGWGFVIVTGFLLYGVIHRYTSRIVDSETEARQLADEAAEQERKLSTLLTNLPGMAYRCRADDGWPMAFVSEGCEELTGYGAADLLNGGISYEGLIAPGDREHVRGEVEGLIAEGRPFTVTYRIVTRDGAEKWVWEQGRQVDEAPDGCPILEGFITDITASKAHEAQNRWLATIVEHSYESVIVADGTGAIEYVNPAFEALWGYVADEVSGENVRMLMNDTVDGAAYDSIWEIVTSRSSWAGRIPGKKKDGSVFEAESTIASIVFEDQAEPSYVLMMRDVTVESLRESRLRQQQKLEALGILAGGIAHDFNNILSAINGYTQLALHDLPKECEATQNLLEVQLACERARGLALRILSFSRQSDRTMAPVCLQDIVEEALRFLRPTLPSVIETDLVTEGSASQVMADSSEMHQIVMNLCTNAYHAMRDKGGLLRIAVEGVELDEEHVQAYPGLKAGKYVCLSISDTGKGMDPKTMERIFEPFFSTKGDEGTGLGLATVHSIIQEHKGAITVYSEPQRGTTFRVYLPGLTVQASADVSESPAPQIPKGHGERILYVDDDEALMNLGSMMLKRLGYQVTPKNSGQDAWDAFRSEPAQFDLVLTDLTMPRPAGFELVKRIRQLRPDIPVILTTGYSENISESRMGMLRISRVLLKPVVMQQLAQAVEEALRANGSAGCTNPMSE